jgi:hypothetical protein
LQLRDLQSTLDGLATAIGQQFVNVAELILRGENRNCFQWTGDQQLLPLSRRDFIVCRDTYIDRAFLYALNPRSTSVASVATSSIPLVLFPFAADYQQLNEDIGPSGSAVANPSVWYGSTTLLLALVQSSNQYLKDVLVEQLDPVIKGGEDLKRFVQSLALDEGKLRRDRFAAIIDRITSTQNELLNKVERQQKNAGVLANIASLKPEPNIDRPYLMLASKGLKFCNGVATNLNAVQNVSVTRSGGCCGTDELVNQDLINRANLGSPGLGWGDLRARVQGALQQVDYSALSLDKSMLKSLNKSVVLMEQTKHNNSVMSYCVNQLNVTHLNMTQPTQIELGLDMHLKVFLTTEGQGGNLTFLVQELAGTRDWRSPFYHLYYDGGARPNALIFEPWKQLQGNFDQFLKPFPNEEADKNRKAVEDEMDGFFGGQRAILYQNVLNGTGSESKQFEHLKRELLLLTKIGLNTNHPAVKAWIQEIESAYQSAEAQVGSIVLNGETMDFARSAVDYKNKSLKDALGELSQIKGLEPDTSAISARLNDLGKLRLMRSTMSLAAVSSKAQ